MKSVRKVKTNRARWSKKTKDAFHYAKPTGQRSMKRHFVIKTDFTIFYAIA